MKKLAFILVAMMMLVSLAACNKASEQSDKKSSNKTIKVEQKYLKYGTKPDGSDAKKVAETVEAPVNPKKVIVFDFGALKTLEDMKADENVVALPKGEDNALLPEFLSKYKDSKYANLGSMKEPNFEKIAELNPDLILINARQANTKTMDELKKAAPKAAVVFSAPDNDRYIDSVKDNTKMLGQIFSKEKEADALVKKLEDKIESAKTMIEKSNKKSLFLLVNEGEMSVFGPKGRFGFIYENLGGKTADSKIKQDTGHGQPVNFEYVNDKNPDIIFAMDRAVAVGGKASSQKTLSNPVLKNVTAIKEKKIIDCDPFLWYLSGGSPTTTIKQIETVEKAFK